jgi:hypothetical protein
MNLIKKSMLCREISSVILHEAVAELIAEPFEIEFA